jgi:phage terminase large subunit-like protein
VPGRSAKPDDPTTAYATAVVKGKPAAGRLVRLAAERHRADLKEGRKRGLSWDAEAAHQAIQFFGFLNLPDGRPFTLLPFEEFIIGSIFGWKASDGSRRFRTAYVEIAKGNGKSPLAGGIGLYGLAADGEQAAEVYSAATTLDQAGILFRDARLMAECSPSLSALLTVDQFNIADPATDSFFRRVSSEHRGLDGKRPHVVLIDELHEHPTDLVVNKMRAGTKGRRQALIFEITNSGYDRLSVCWRHHEYSRKILEGDQTAETDAWFAYVCTLDPCAKCAAEGKHQPTDNCPDCDDWRDEKVWPKANPGLGQIIQPKYLREQVAEAKGMPANEGIVKRLNFCVWTESVARAIPMDKWDAAGDPDPLAWRKAALERLKHSACVGGLDLGSTGDLTALALLFQEPDGVYTVLPFFWCPALTARKRSEKDRIPYALWVNQGLVTETGGDVTDYGRVRADLALLMNDYAIEELAVDRLFQGVQLCTDLAQDGFNVVAFGQGFSQMAGPVKRFLELVAEAKIRHGGHPVLRWMASNTAAECDSSGKALKFCKDNETGKIDGVVATVMALGRAMLRPEVTAMMETWG